MTMGTILNSLSITMLMVVSHQMFFTDSVQVGVNYGRYGNNLPAPKDVVNFLKSKRITMVRIFDPSIEVLEALRGSSLSVCIGATNGDLANLASSPQATTEWLNKYIIPFKNEVAFQFISIGNEAIPGPDAQHILPALRNMYESLKAAGMSGTPVTTVVAGTVLAKSYPPSQGAFGDQMMKDIVRFLNSIVEPLMVNAYPYFALKGDPTNIKLDYALLTAKTPAFRDNGVDYYNLIDAQIDAFAAAIERAVGNNETEIIVSETGWPTSGSRYANVENARIYNNNFKRHALKGSPRYGRPFDAFIFALFNENLKEGPEEQNFGNFYPNMKPVYPLW